MENKNPHKNKVHRILAHSYAVYFVLFLIGIYLDLVFRFTIFNNSFLAFVGVYILILGTILILWAQKTSRNLKKDDIDKVNKETFYKGPYRYTRSPTHLGLFFLILGFGILANAFFVVLSAFISLIITKFVFIDKQEKILAEKYGSHYLEYKKSVKF